MQARTRMFMTLGCLALAMTACTALLAWLEPQGRRSAGLADVGSTEKQALAAAEAGGDVGSLRRGVIEIVALTGGAWRQSPALAATRRSDIDFVVFGDGAIRAGMRWRRRSNDEVRESPICVYVADIANRGDLPAIQWVGLRALLTALEHRIEWAGGHLFIRIGPSIGAGSARFASTLRQLLMLNDLALSGG